MQNIKINKCYILDKKGVDFSLQDLINEIKNPCIETKNLIENIRNEKVKGKREEFKKQLPAFFVGNYKNSERNSKSLISTNAMIFDFDCVDNIEELKERLNKLKPLLLFNSPSGNGIKAIFMLSSEIIDTETYRNTYDFIKSKLQAKLSEKNIKVDNTSDCVRLCFMSHDQNLIYNKEPFYFDVIKPEPKKEIVKKTIKNNIQWTEDNQVVTDLLVAIQKKGRPDYLDWKKILFAIADKIGKQEAINTMQGYFPEEKQGEYEKAFSSPLTNIHFGSLFYYADIDPKEYYRSKLTIRNKRFDYIKYSENKTEKQAEKENIIWHIQSKKGANIQYTEFKKYLNSIGYYSYIINQADTGKIKYGIVKKQDNIMQFVDPKQVAIDIQNRLEDIDDQWAKDILEIINNPRDRIFTSDYLSGLKTIKEDLHCDTEDKSYIYYANCYVEITKNNVITKDYKELDKPVWRKSIVCTNPNSITTEHRKQRSFKIETQEDINIYEHLDFYHFVKNINNQDKKAILRFETAIGFLLHRYKNPDCNKAIILHDKAYSGGANGRTGKSLSASCLQYIRNVVEQDGEKFNQTSAFRFDKINYDTEIYFLNDIDENLNFRTFYNAITNSWDIEKKGQSSISIPFEKSPKIIITTNYAVGDTNDSDVDRKREIGLHKHYRPDFHPSDEFGRRFFDHYDDIDWLMYDYYMIHCIQMYLSYGLYDYKEEEEEHTKLIHRIGKDFFDFCEDFFIAETGKFGNTQAKNQYCISIGCKTESITNAEFLNKIKKYCEYKKINLKEKLKTNEGANATGWAKMQN